MKKKLIPFTLMLMVCTGCTEFAMISSGTTIAVSHNAYAKAYSGMVGIAFRIKYNESSMATLCKTGSAWKRI